MQDRELKLIAVINSMNMLLYEAKGLKIITQFNNLLLNLEEHNHQKLEKKQSHYQNKSTPGSLFEPHTTPKEIEHNESARAAAKYLEKTVNEFPKKYRELILVAEPKMLGCVRLALNNNLKKMVTKELAKDLLNHDIKAIESAIFS